jgi:hypothetical protein
VSPVASLHPSPRIRPRGVGLRAEKPKTETKVESKVEVKKAGKPAAKPKPAAVEEDGACPLTQHHCPV